MFGFGKSKEPRATPPPDARLAAVDVPRVDFQIVGSMKCGTTTLRRALGAHPDIHMPKGEQHFFGNHRALVAMTSVGGEIAALSGDIVNPYPDAKLGVIEKGAYADILLVDGNPLEDLAVIGSEDKWFDGPDRPEGVETIRLIMKDGKIYKNTL